MTRAPVSPRGDYIAAFAPRVEVDPRFTAFVVVDLQHGFASRSVGLGGWLDARGLAEAAEYRFARIEQLVVPNVVRLLGAFRAARMRSVFLVTGARRRDYSDLPPHLSRLCRATNARVGEREYEILEQVAPRSDEPVLHKSGMSALHTTPLETLLQSWGVRTLVFAGLTTNMCVEHNVRDAADRGFGCIVVEDGCATDSPQMHEASLRNVGRLYGSVASTDEVIAEVAAEALHA